MPTSNSTFNARTTGHEIVAAYPSSAKDKIILITGANPGGIGASSAVSLAAAHPKLLIIAGRTPAKLAETEKEIKAVNPSVAVKHLQLDLSSQQSCKAAAKEIMDDASVPQVDLLINNAGVMDIKERTLSPEGIEMQFATNHIGHFLFTNLIMPKILAASKTSNPGETRIINLSSRAVLYGPVRFLDWNFTKKESELPASEHMSQAIRDLWEENEDKPYVPQAGYGQSKTANVLFSKYLTNKLFAKNGIVSIAVHPGGIMTNLSRHVDDEKLQRVLEKFKKTADSKFFLKNLDEGCSTTLVAALDPKMTEGDLFMEDCQVAGWAPDYATSSELADKLWKLSEEIVGQEFEI
ncbi:hypothetical protein H2198_004398 [Neophaeococcomyces mojaviensis]|uniref:Uncharacterized protein n=1 Tax=Neophaeococcomyces mojaviensis TaxID=3383035 RepID=A0ACC3A8V5_9EURO|nr:hypothetical protein H2198_004398 [Knufia sp. JES_112]